MVSENSKLEPYIVVIGKDTPQAYLVVDNHIVNEVPIADVPFALMAAYFVFNICYPKGCNNLYSFLEVVVLNYSAEKASPSVKYFLAKINVH